MTTVGPRPQHWLINVRSGNGAGERLLVTLQGSEGVFAEAINFHALPSQIRSISPDALIVVAGGDGTFSAVCGSPDAEGRDIACVPIGTANDLAREFSIDRHMRGALYRDYPALIRSLSLHQCSVWTVKADGRESPCINYVSIGYEGSVVRDFSSWRTRTTLQGRLFNRVAYAMYGLRHALYRLTNLRVEDEDHVIHSCPRTTGLIVTNIRSHLGLGLSNTSSDPGDTTIECVSVPTVFGFLRMIIASLGIGQGLPALASGSRVAIQNIPPHTPIQIDGEPHPLLEGGELAVTFRHFVKLASAHP